MLGLKREKQGQKKVRFIEAEQRMIIEDYLQSGLTKREIWAKYTGRLEGENLLLYWMRKYGYLSDNKEKNAIFASKTDMMSSQNNTDERTNFEVLQLEKRISELENRLKESEMKSIAWQTMIELAEKEFNISIKKKFNIKPSKK